MSATVAAAGRLSHLLDLAEQGPAIRAALAEEVAELLSHWPAECPQAMRPACESLLVRCARDVAPAARARLRVLLYADPALCARALPRRPADCLLVETARSGGDVGAALAEALGLDGQAARDILDDASGRKLAIACKAAGIERAAFSALALTLGPHRDRLTTYALLDCFDSINVADAHRRLREWRAPLQPEVRRSA
jgi:hypothetical protein